MVLEDFTPGKTTDTGRDAGTIPSLLAV